MTRSKRLRPIVRLAEHAEAEAARILGDAQRAVAVQRQRLDDLESYRDEYSRRFDSAAAVGIAGVMVHDFRLFLARLNEAIKHQEAVVLTAQREHEARRHLWLEARGRVGALDKAVGRFREEESIDDARREQHETDEHAQLIGGGTRGRR